MSYQVLARKWRPRNFQELVGQDHVVRALTNALEQNRLHHAYLFTGTRGVGKTTIARILAKCLNCESGITAIPCGICPACIGIDQDRFIDYLEINAASTRGIDDIRALLEQATYAPAQGRFKVFMLDEVHQLTKEAFNALLKTLEEPPPHIKFILGTTDPQKVPVTVLSRCLQFNLRQMASTTINTHLHTILTQENIRFEATALHLIARAAAGSMRDALSLTDQAIAYGEQTVNEAEVRVMLGAIDQDYLYQLIEALLASDGASLIAQAKAMEVRSLSFETALNDLALLFHQIAVAQIVPDSIADDLPERNALLALAQKISPETLQLYYQITILGYRDMGLAPDEFAGFTMSLLRMLAFTPNEISAPKPIKKAFDTSSASESKLALETPLIEKAGKKNVKPAASVENQTAFVVEKPIDSIKRVENVLEHDTKIVTTSSDSRNFNGNWRALLDELKLGLVRTLAQHCELISYDENNILLSVPESQKHLIIPSYQEKLSNAISQYFDRKIKLQFNIGGTGNTPAKQIYQEKAHAQANAQTAIEEDVFVQALINDFDAQIIPNSIKPL